MWYLTIAVTYKLLVCYACKLDDGRRGNPTSYENKAQGRERSKRGGEWWGRVRTRMAARVNCWKTVINKAMRCPRGGCHFSLRLVAPRTSHARARAHAISCVASWMFYDDTNSATIHVVCYVLERKRDCQFHQFHFVQRLFIQAIKSDWRIVSFGEIKYKNELTDKLLMKVSRRKFIQRSLLILTSFARWIHLSVVLDNRILNKLLPFWKVRDTD